MSRRLFIRTLLACCLALVTWFNFAPNAAALGGKLPTINKLALLVYPTDEYWQWQSVSC